MKILAVETSCDETAIAIADFSRTKVKVLSHIVLSQIPVHKKFGGVVPNLTKREHQKNLVPILLQTLKESGMWKVESSNKKSHSTLRTLHSSLEREPELLARFRKNVLLLKPPPIDSIAVTYGPGLAPALWVGVNFAKTLAYLWDKPLIPVNHMAGHAYSALLQPDRIKKPKPQIARPRRGSPRAANHEPTPNVQFQIINIKFPALVLLVSGGHTELVVMRGHGKFKVIGETLDDAAGEAFDKVARILDLGYPGGPEISAEAEKFKTKVLGLKVRLPRPMINSKDYNFSFSGLKTAVLYLTRDLGAKRTRQLRPLIAKEFQDAVVEVLVKKTVRAARQHKIKTVLLGGGVTANKELRKKLFGKIRKETSKAYCWMPEAALAGDNALMIALAAHFKWVSLAPKRRAAYFSGKKKAWSKVHADANVRLGRRG